jgi:hypothetical protein
MALRQSRFARCFLCSQSRQRPIAYFSAVMSRSITGGRLRVRTAVVAVRQQPCALPKVAQISAGNLGDREFMLFGFSERQKIWLVVVLGAGVIAAVAAWYVSPPTLTTMFGAGFARQFNSKGESSPRSTEVAPLPSSIATLQSPEPPTAQALDASANAAERAARAAADIAARN